MTHHSDATTPALRLIVRAGALRARRESVFELVPDTENCAAIASALGLRALRKVRFTGHLRPLGHEDWELRADLGATVVQDCVVTLAPVTTRIDERVERRFLARMPEPLGDEIEMPEDEDAEPLGETIDIGAVAIEALTLALPPFPRAADAELAEDGTLRSAPPGQEPLSEGDLKPFAQLAALRARMDGPDDGNGST